MSLFELIQVALGAKAVLSHTLSEEEWSEIYRQAEKQAVLGICFQGVQQLKESKQYPPKGLLFQWIAVAEQIKKQNALAFRRSHEITKLFAESGFRSCILKGQGNSMMYANPYSRMSGDIDIWVDGSREEINKFVKGKCSDAFEQEHHIEFPIFRDVEVEVHYKPCTLLSPAANRQFLKWCQSVKDSQMSHKVGLPVDMGAICVPTADFNVVFQMAHIMIHFFIEGIGLRHFVDYFYVLRQFKDDGLELRDSLKVRKLFKDFGLLRFAGGVMWIERECLGLENKYLLIEPDEKRGKVILKEMLEGGNFGHHDERYKSRNKGYIARGVTDVFRLLKLATVFPSESLWKIYRKVENQKWKLKL